MDAPTGNRNIFRDALARWRAGQHAEAASMAERLVALESGDADALHLLGMARSALGEHEAAAAAFERALAQTPEDAALLCNAGQALRRAGRSEYALELLLAAIGIGPLDAEPRFALGNALRDLGRDEAAIARYRECLEREPNHRGARRNLAAALLATGRVVPALPEVERLVRDDPRDVEGLILAAQVYAAHARHGDAERAWLAASALAPSRPDLLVGAAIAQHEQGEIERARETYQREMRLGGDPRWRRLHLDGLCPPIMPDAEAIDAYRDWLGRALERHLAEAPRLDIARLPHGALVQPPMELAYHGRPDRPLLDRYGELFARVIAPLETRPGTGRPRIGLVVTHGHEGIFERCMGGMVRQLAVDPELELELVCTQAGATVLHHLLGGPAIRYRLLEGDLVRAARQLADARYDLLHYWEVGTDSTNYLLPFFAPAPVQICGWGWPVTSTNPRIAAYTGCRRLEPDGGQAHYTEPLALTDSLPTRYERPLSTAGASRADFGLADSDHAYFCCQNVRKLHPDVDGLFAGILERDPAAVVLLVAHAEPAINALLTRRLAATLGKLYPRVRLIERLERPRFLALVEHVDVMLDTPHYSGCTSSYDAVAMGTPMVTLPGAHYRSRWTTAIAERIGLARELVARDPDDYVARAVVLGSDGERQRALRREILERGAVLFEDPLPARELAALWLEHIARARR